MADQLPSAGTWRVMSPRTNVAEIAATNYPAHTYSVRATRKDVRVSGYVNGQLAEEICVLRGMREYLVDLEVGPSILRLASSSTHDVMETLVLTNDEEFLVRSRPEEHGERVGAELKKRNIPETPVLKLLIDAVRHDKALLAEIRKHAPYGPEVLVREAGNGQGAACAMECFLCALGYEFGCLACSLCVQMQMT